MFLQDGRVYIWTCDDPTSNSWTPKLLHKFNDVVWHVSWSITANILAVSGGDNKVWRRVACTIVGEQSRKMMWSVSKVISVNKLLQDSGKYRAPASCQ